MKHCTSDTRTKCRKPVTIKCRKPIHTRTRTCICNNFTHRQVQKIPYTTKCMYTPATRTIHEHETNIIVKCLIFMLWFCDDVIIAWASCALQVHRCHNDYAFKCKHKRKIIWIYLCPHFLERERWLYMYFSHVTDWVVIQHSRDGGARNTCRRLLGGHMRTRWCETNG